MTWWDMVLRVFQAVVVFRGFGPLLPFYALRALLPWSWLVQAVTGVPAGWRAFKAERGTRCL